MGAPYSLNIWNSKFYEKAKLILMGAMINSSGHVIVELIPICLRTSIDTPLSLSPLPTFSSTPFATGPEDNAEKILTRIGEGKVNLSGGNWDSISKGAKDLVLRMLNIDPSQRYSAAQVLNHSWISSRESLPDIKLSIRDTKIKV